MSSVKHRVAALEQESADFGSAEDLTIRMLAARDGGAAIFAALSPAQQRAYRERRSAPSADELILRLAAERRNGSTWHEPR